MTPLCDFLHFTCFAIIEFLKPDSDTEFIYVVLKLVLGLEKEETQNRPIVRRKGAQINRITVGLRYLCSYSWQDAASAALIY